ncbi:MAG: hypothetical protein D6732_11945 [Methanobacteriota archaeon]|nr:MAG: hypothetical protein D6732_11945 [Euryarchaeota archaeon]
MQTSHNQVFSGLSLVDKKDGVQYTVGLGCSFTPKVLLDDTDQDVLVKKANRILESFTDNPFPSIGYITLQKNSEEVLLYYNYSRWMVFLTLVSSNLLQHFLGFNALVQTLRKILDKETPPKMKVEEIIEQIIPKTQAFYCNKCSYDTCTTGSLNKMLVQNVPNLSVLDEDHL